MSYIIFHVRYYIAYFPQSVDFKKYQLLYMLITCHDNNRKVFVPKDKMYFPQPEHIYTYIEQFKCFW